MLKKFFLLSLFISSIIFFYFVAIFYLSEKNIKQINTNRSNLSEIINDNTKDLPLIKNDTNNVINFNSGYENNNENYKRSFWDLFKK